jgi:tetratricopeptide (TPR) repeat protein
MATYNKRGYKAPKEKVEKVEVDSEEKVIADGKNSTTAEVFNSLDQTASKAEDWIARNQKIILGIVAVIAVVTVSYLLFQKFVVEPKEENASNDMFTAQQNFQKASSGTSSDSLYTLSLKGAEGKFGFVDIAKEYEGTAAGNLANYYAGMAYLNTGKYNEAVTYLEKFKSEDVFLSVLAQGGIGDAYSELNQPQKALEYYIKASEMNENNFTTPRFLMKAGTICMAMNKKADALKYFTQIKEKYQSSPEGANIDGLIGLAQ